MPSDNLFLARRYDGMPDLPPRFYALLDQDAGDRTLFDAVSAPFFDDRRDRPTGLAGWTRDADRAPIFVIEVEDKAVLGLRSWFRSWTEGREPIDEIRFPIWFEFWQDEQGFPAAIYHNLYAESRPVRLNCSLVDPKKALELEAAFSLDDHEATQSEIEAALANLTGRLDWVAVYDVGQGGANGLCDAGEAPLAYFDLGGGVLANTGTFPTGLLTDFCYLHDPPVVLSHWDWDHWSSGNTFSRAQSLKWIVPNQTLGAVHTTFAAALASAGNLLVWPSTLASVQVGAATITKCHGSGRNHSGLALEIAGPNGEQPILLTGDARYSAVPGAVFRSYTSVVTPHHGADMKSHATPRGASLPGARAAYSFGVGNTFGHPRAVTEIDHDANGWPHASRGAPVGVERHTVALRPSGLGHIGLGWSPSPVLPGHRCGQAGCALGLVQT